MALVIGITKSQYRQLKPDLSRISPNLSSRGPTVDVGVDHDTGEGGRAKDAPSPQVSPELPSCQFEVGTEATKVAPPRCGLELVVELEVELLAVLPCRDQVIVEAVDGEFGGGRIDPDGGSPRPSRTPL